MDGPARVWYRLFSNVFRRVRCPPQSVIRYASQGQPVMGTLRGSIAVAGLPPHRGLIVSVCFYGVVTADAPVPYGGDPPAAAATDCLEVVKRVDPQVEVATAAYELPFTAIRPDGFYYLQVRALLFRFQGGKLLAQAEQFFFGRRPLQVAGGTGTRVTVPVSWPTTPVAALHSYGTVRPRHTGDA